MTMRRPLLLGTIAVMISLVLSFLLDVRIVEAARLLENSALDIFFRIVTDILFVVGVMLLFPLAILLYKRKTILSASLLSSFTLAVGASFFLKLAIARARPEVAALTVSDLAVYAFPSMHAAVSFAVLPVLWKPFPRARWCWLGMAVFISLSRLYFGVHYLSDIIAGALLGLAIGYLIVRSHEARA